ncbi:hypothetical protein HWV62_32573 [Athelia sp. TMB]|nr:hypothetical protein HWV62_32573 [Athelia sp. TMB]
MASKTLSPARQASVPPSFSDPARSPSQSRQASVEPSVISKPPSPTTKKVVEREISASRARSVSVEPEVSTPKATTPPPQSSGQSRAESLEPTTAGQPPPDTIDMDTFQQILDLDEDGTREFSRGMAWAYFSQVDSTFVDMDKAFDNKDLVQLSTLGHFLKGSSAALGVSKVQASCEKIQHYGQLRDEEEDKDLSKDDALGKIEPLLGVVKKEYNTAEKWMKAWFLENDPDGEEPE